MDRLKGLTDEPRPGAPRKITDEQVERVITAILEQSPPKNDRHWSTRSMATVAGNVVVGDLADLAGIRAQAAPGGNGEAVHRPRSSMSAAAPGHESESLLTSAGLLTMASMVTLGFWASPWMKP